MSNPNTNYEVRDGKLLVDGEAIPLRKGVVYAALARAGWTGREGPLPLELVAEMLRLDRRVTLLALAREVESVA